MFISSGKRLCALPIIILLLPSVSWGADISRDKVMQDIVTIADRFSGEKRTNAEIWPRITQKNCAPASHHSQRAKALEQEAQAKDSEPALEVNASASSGLTGSQAEERNARVGVEWRLLGEGVLDNHYWAEQLDREASLARVDAKADRLKRNIQCQTQGILSLFADPRLQLLNRWDRFLDTILTAATRDYLRGELLLDRVLDFEADKRLVKQQLGALRRRDTASQTESPKAFTLDFEAVRSAVRDHSLLNRELALRTAITRNERELERRRARQLSVKVGYEVDEDDSPSRGLFGGIRYSMPLFPSSYDASTDSRVSAHRTRRRNAIRARLANLKRLQAEFEQQRRRVIRQHYRYLKARERLRRSAAELRLDSMDPNLGAAVVRANEVFSAAHQRLLARKVLYRKAGRVFEAAVLAPRPRFFEPIGIPASNYRARTGNRSLYVWSRTLDALTPDELIEFAKAQGINRLSVSTGPPASHSDDTLPARLRRAAASGEITLERLIGASAWALPRYHSNAISRLERIGAPGGGLHLDIEPQTLSKDTGTHPSHLEGYLELLRRIANNDDISQAIHVSVPASWPRDAYGRISRYVDRIYLMAYPSGDTTEVVGKLQKIRGTIGKANLVVALRIGDFQSPWDLEKSLRKVEQATGIKSFALHDADGLLSLTRESTR